jgi:asparagine synthase (glutamine-hydrolysing)
VEIAEGIPFARLTQYDVPALYALKGEIVRRGVRAVAGIDMPVFPKRRFQHGAVPASALRGRIARPESEYRRIVYDLFTVPPTSSTGAAPSVSKGLA